MSWKLFLIFGDYEIIFSIKGKQSWKILWFFQIEDGEIHASINQKDGMVVFLDNPEKYNCPAMMTRLDKEVIYFFNIAEFDHFKVTEKWSYNYYYYI